MRSICALGLTTLFLMITSPSVAFATTADIRKLKKEIGRACLAGEWDAAIPLVGEISAVGGEDAVEALYDVALRFGHTKKLYDAIVKELVRHEAETMKYLDDRYDRVDNKGDFQERVFIAEVLGNLGTEQARKKLIVLLEDKADPVRQQAVKGLALTMHKDAVAPLIALLEDLLKQRRDLLYYEVRDALWELTGEDFDLIEDWKSWWSVAESNFDPKKQDDHDGQTKVRKKRRGEDPEFFGVPVNSKNIVFVIDTSGSMMYVMKNDIPGLAKGDGSDGGNATGGGKSTPEDQKLAEFWTRMEMAKRELRKVLMRLDRAVVFNMLNFDNQTYVFGKGKSLVATPGNKKKALEWAESLRFRRDGATNTMDALVEAFKADPRTNTIFFLSDGLPSADGKTDDPQEPILDRVFSLNRFRKIKIHTFGYNPEPYPYGSGHPPYPSLVQANDFLKKLAESTGGTFTMMSVDTKYTPADPFGPDDDPKPRNTELGAKAFELRALQPAP